jgi:hypothetical protein
MFAQLFNRKLESYSVNKFIIGIFPMFNHVCAQLKSFVFVCVCVCVCVCVLERVRLDGAELQRLKARGLSSLFLSLSQGSSSIEVQM